MKNTKFRGAFGSEASGETAGEPGRDARLLGRLMRVARFGKAWFALLFALGWPLYAGFEMWHHLTHPHPGYDTLNTLVVLLTFVYGVVFWTQLQPRVVYTQQGAPPQRVIHDHYHRRRWF